MAIESWQNIIDLIQAGEPVSAEVANRAVNQLVKRTEHLKDRQDAQNLAQSIFISDAPLTDAVRAGHAVYFDLEANAFAPAYAAVEFKNGLLQPKLTSNVVGIVVYKDTLNSGVIAVAGWISPAQYFELDCEASAMLENLLESPDYKGTLYLTSDAINAGRVTEKPGLLNVPVCDLISPNHMLVRPSIPGPIHTQAVKLKISNEIAGYGLTLIKGQGANAQTFESNFRPPVGAKVSLYMESVAAPNPSTDIVYLTATVHAYTPWSGNGNIDKIELKDIKVTKALVEALSDNNGNYANVFKGTAQLTLKLKDLNTLISYAVSVNGFSSYDKPVVYDAEAGWFIYTSYTNPNKPGWLPIDSGAFTDVSALIPAGAKFGYNVRKDPILNQLFSETVVTSYIVTKDGIILSDQVVEINSAGIWWKDNKIQLPWHTVGTNAIIPDTQVDLEEWAADSNKIILPSELYIVYARLATGGVKVVTSLETNEGSPITITDPFGNPATSGPLKLTADLSINELTANEPGSLVVKEFAGFNVKRGRVVERITAGNNIALTSSFPGGQGELSIGVVGLDGKLEGQPDILAVDDVLVERDSAYDLFYSIFPASKSSSILGKINIPSYLVGNYRVLLSGTFIALHASGDATLPKMHLTWTALPSLNTPTSLSQATKSNSVNSFDIHSGQLASRSCVLWEDYLFPAKVIPNTSVFFKLTRNGNDGYGSKLGLISLNYKFIKFGGI